MKNLKLAISTCPNDTYIFYALINNKLKENKFDFDVFMGDIAELNKLAFNKKYDIIKVSFNAFGYLLNDYNLLDSGSALGKGCGPILISKRFSTFSELNSKTIGIPGEYTTANYLFDFASKINTNKVYMRFDEIIPAIIDEKIDAGVIIHESRFTYKKYCLNKIIDLGDFWEKSSGCHIPLGGIIVRNTLSNETQQEIDKLIKLSIEYSRKNFREVLPFIKKYAKELDEDVIMSHINLYVNEYTYSLGKKGSDTLTYFYKSGFEKGIFKNFRFNIVGQNGQG